jgi:hypothetical protein
MNSPRQLEDAGEAPAMQQAVLPQSWEKKREIERDLNQCTQHPSSWFPHLPIFDEEGTTNRVAKHLQTE